MVELSIKTYVTICQEQTNNGEVFTKQYKNSDPSVWRLISLLMKEEVLAKQKKSVICRDKLTGQKKKMYKILGTKDS